jgi:YebC/PmpR family DNA-binding regulatory protein
MGTSWKQAGKQENSAKRGAIISKLCKEIIVAAKSGDPDPANNARLRTVVEAAKKASVPRDNIERAIKKGAGLLEPVNYDLVTFEGFTPHKVPIIVECLTDNRNRTSADIRSLFKKGALGAAGSVAYMFNHVGMVEATHSNKALDVEEAAIEAGAQEVEKTEDGARFTCEKSDLIAVSKALTDMGWHVTASEFVYTPKDPVEVSEAAKKEITPFLNDLDDNDDVHRIFTALK